MNHNAPPTPSAPLTIPDRQCPRCAVTAAEGDRWRLVALALAERLTLLGHSDYAHKAFEQAGLLTPELTRREQTGQDLPERKVRVR